MAEESKTFMERFEILNEKFKNFKNEGTNLEEAGIKELNTKIGFLVELDNNIRGLAKEIKSNTNDADLVNDGETLGSISRLLKSLEEESNDLRDAQRGREKLRNKIIDEKHVLDGQRDEFDFKVSDVNEKISEENQVLDMELSLVDRNYHESLLNVYKNYIDALNEERVPVDELYNKYNNEMNLLLEGGKPNYILEDGNLVENSQTTIPEIKKEDVISENTIMDEEPKYVEELVEQPILEEKVEEPLIEEKTEVEEEKDIDLEEIRNEVASELAEVNKDEENVESDKKVFNPFGEYLGESNETEEALEENTTEEKQALEENPTEEKQVSEEKTDVVDDNPIFDENFAFEPLSENIDEPVVSEEKVEQPKLEESEEDKFDMLAALKNFRKELDDFGSDDKLEVVDKKEASIDLLKKVTPEVLENATNYMKQYNKEEVQEQSNNVEEQYKLRDGETLSASVTDENGEEKTVEIDPDGTKTVKDTEGNIINTEHIDLDENTLNGENFKVVDTSDINISKGEEPQDLVPHMPDFSSLEEAEEGYARKMVA